ncbi:hypothetical protein [Photobacterium leiognathi]|uniref:hypothetical protein n=1 Tax=Photobacterium leiognathi TaxID=553611 RepID=UPI002738A1D4|nr:hypothetical protein [Photobacterium leiognathi]
MPINTINTILSGVKSATDIGQLLVEAHSSYDKAQLKIEIEKLVDTLHDVKKQTRALEDELYEKDREIKRLNEKLEQKSKAKVTIIGQFAYTNNPEGIPVGQAYCASCYENDEALKSFAIVNTIAACSKCKCTVHFMEAKRIMTPELFESIKAEHSHIIKQL